MRQGTRIVIGLFLMVGITAAVFGWRNLRGNSAQPAEKAPEAGSVAAEAVTPAALPSEAPAEHASEGTVASPPAPPVHDEAERSFRARPIEPSPESAATAPAERTGLTELTTPAAAPTEATTPPAETPGVTAPTPVNPTEAVTAAPAAGPVTEKPAIANSSSPAGSSTEHVLQPGETYSSLAAKYLGSPKYAGLIAKANPGKDPRRLYVGAKIKIPPAPAAANTAKLSQPGKDAAPGSKDATSAKAVRAAAEPAAPIAPDRAYKVQPGESWQDLAGRFLHDRGRWTELYELNKERVPRNPQHLPNGTVIELPKGVSATSKPS